MFKKIIKVILNRFNYQIVSSIKDFPIPEASNYEKNLIKKALKYSMTNEIRAWSLINSIKYVINNNIDGDFVECGVFKGGNLIIFKDFIIKYSLNKKIYGYDTFEGMSEPSNFDKRYLDNKSAKDILSRQTKKSNSDFNFWCYADLDEVLKNLGTDKNEKVKLIKGKVENTLLEDNNLPNKISILRLDTDFYESTKIELERLYPLLVDKGILIIDDYGYWQGAKKAVDEYFKDQNIFLQYIDHDCRLFIKNNN